MNTLLEITRKALEKNGIFTEYCKTKAELIPLLQTLIPDGATIANGGSTTLAECGIFEWLKNQSNYKFLDRNNPNLTSEELENILSLSSSCDFYLCSSNAVTQDDILYNVDGKSNRVSAIAFGPKKVIMVVSTNKIVKYLDEAVKRVKTIAAPLNTQRLQCATPCQKTGQCLYPDVTAQEMTKGCDSPSRICCNFLVSAKQRVAGRITVIFLEEKAGF